MLFGDIKEAYNWELETVDGVVYQQYDNEGKERSRKLVLPEDVIRFSLVPTRLFLPRHDTIIDKTHGEQFVESKARGFMKTVAGEFQLVEYIHCIVTFSFRVWVFSSSGRCMVTHKDFDNLYI